MISPQPESAMEIGSSASRSSISRRSDDTREAARRFAREGKQAKRRSSSAREMGAERFF